MKDISSLNNNFPWLVFNLNKSFFALSCENITGITILPKKVTQPVLTPPYIRGLLNLRGEIIPLVDMRELFAFPTTMSEFEDFKKFKVSAITAHQGWVDELVRCVEEEDTFTRELNPDKCAFGKWLLTFDASNNIMNSYLRKIDPPHRQLHQEGGKIVELHKQPQSSEREKKIQESKENVTKVLAPTIFSILAKIEEDWCEAHKEMVIIFTYNDKKIGLIVDEVQSVECLEILNQEVNIDMQNIAHFFSSIARSTRSNNVIFLVDETELGILFSEADFGLEQETMATLSGVEA